jgi:antirestriction protein ArdC
MNRNDIYQSITDKIKVKLEVGVLPWRKSWQSGIPCNLISKRHYNGINFLSLIAEDHPSPYYLTFLQCKERGGKVLEGAKGALIIFWKMHVFENAADPNTTAKVPILRYSYVFNLSQTTLYSDTTDEVKLLSYEEAIKNISPAPVIRHNIHKCYYSMAGDYISIPVITDFDNPGEYYSSLFHELVHWTGAANRLNRDLTKTSHAEEELIAEIGSAYLCGMCGISPQVIDGNTSYINGWLSKAKGEPNLFIRASIQAQKAVDFLLSTSIYQNIDVTTTNDRITAL